MFEDADDVTEATDAHIQQVLLGQVQQHVPLDTVVVESNGIICRIAGWDASLSEKLDPV